MRFIFWVNKEQGIIMAYNEGNASTFNQLIQQGLSVEQAAQQSGISTAASSYGYGTNSNAGAVIPGAGGTIDATGLTQVPYAQPGAALPLQSPLQTSTPVVDPRVTAGTPPPPTTNAAAQAVDEFTGIDAQVAATTATPIIDPRVTAGTPPPPTTNAAAQAVDEFTGIDPQVAANAAEPVIDPRVTAGTPPPPTTNAAAQAVDEFTGIDPQVAANAAEPVVDPRVSAGAPPPPTTGPDAVVADEFTGIDPQVASNEALPVEQSDAETARLARLELDATPNESSAEFNRLQEKNVQAVVGTQLAQRQAVLDAQRKMVNNGDWRVRLSLAQGAQYLYNASSPGILAPLAKTGGVIFPYMPKIDMTYKANYTPYDLTHSNYRGYFYQNSSVDSVTLNATFTAQDTTEADYLLAVIHFFRSVTKMFYGQDAQRGAPPPLVYLTGLGTYQFSAHPCAVTTFTYNLPNDVDYIRAGSTNINGTNLLTRRTRQDLPTNPITGAIKRLENLFSSQGINKGAISNPSAPPTLGKNSPTYVPTKIDLNIGLIPMQTRAQVSQVFSLKSFANGDLIKGGFW
jgi:hypothetical protein